MKHFGTLTKQRRDGFVKAVPHCALLSSCVFALAVDLKLVFQHYAASDDNGPLISMDETEFRRLVLDCKFGLSRNVVRSIFREAGRATEV